MEGSIEEIKRRIQERIRHDNGRITQTTPIMRIKIKWLPQAIALLDNIYRFYSKKSQTAAIRLYNKLLDSAEPLRVFPQAGPIEPLLKEYDCEFRSLVVEKHYKLIYTVTDELIEIHAVWDCRQEGWRLQEMFK